jgi:hypothetical protein
MLPTTERLPLGEARMSEKYSKEFLDRLRREWLGGSAVIFGADRNKEDHRAISKWILGLLNQETLSEEDELMVSRVYHSLNFDIPFAATASVRAELLHIVRMKI